ncbi:MAG: MBL fold metallo-hydrolase [Candidatus Riflebacteria bacterium]|nr:MBL fold metallo-hydrolase [Candidatus Riflebacteria bacterium]
MMKLFFLGGADEVGASSMLVETGGRRLLVDCGVRQGARSRDPLPDLALAQSAGGVDAVLITHAHLDHTGALPIVHGAYPNAPVFAAEPTRPLVRILLTDSLKIMGGRFDAEGEVPLYPPEAVDSLVARIEPCRFLEPEEVLPGISVTFFPAGHILGAATLAIESSEGRLWISGDISVADQLTVPGMLTPRVKADAVVVESTYGDRVHANREAQERRLAEAVGAVVESGGKVLIPAFAIGRAQEVILTLRRAMAMKQLKRFPVFVDGMVRAVCEVYSGHPDWVSPWLRRKIEKSGNPFWGQEDCIRPVTRPEERAAIVGGPPCCIVASSGMLTGGPSAFYAAALMPGEANLIAITGYQDEESPGRRLLELADGASGEIALGGQKVRAACRIARYNLSAHADSGELAGLVGKLRPKDLILVHGQDEARKALSAQVSGAVRQGIHLPALGESLGLSYRTARRPVTAVGLPAGKGPGPLDDPALLRRLGALVADDPPNRGFDLVDLAKRCLGQTVDRAARERFRALLTSPESPLEPDPKRPYLFRRKQAATVARGAGTGQVRDADGRLEQNAALAVADRLFGPATGLYRKGASRESWQLVLYFHFPLVVQRLHGERLAELSRETGWGVTVHPETHQASLAEAAVEVTPVGWATPRTSAIRRESRQVVVWCFPKIPRDPSVAAPARREFPDRTGCELVFETDHAASDQAPRVAVDSQGRFEINQAYGAIRRAFVDQPHAPRKLGLKGDAGGPFIEVAFISGQVAALYRPLLDQVSRTIGWRIELFTRADQQAILQLARSILPARWALRKGPGLDASAGLVKLQLLSGPDPGDLEDVRRKLKELTGFDLSVDDPGEP